MLFVELLPVAVEVDLAALCLANCSGHDICFKDVEEVGVVETGVATVLVPGSSPPVPVVFELVVVLFLFSFSSESTLGFFGFCCNFSRLLSCAVCLRFKAILTTEVEGLEFESPSCPEVVEGVGVGGATVGVKPCPGRSFFEVIGTTVGVVAILAVFADLKSLSASLDRSFFLFVDLIFSVIDKLLVPLPIVLELFFRLRPGSSPGELLDFELFMTRLGSSSRSLIRLSSELELDKDNLPLDSRLIRSEALEAAALR